MHIDVAGSALVGQPEARILVLPLTDADGDAIAKLLDAARIHCRVVAGITELCDAIGTGTEGAHGLILSEEAALAHAPQVLACIAGQPMWSELPVIVLSKAGHESNLLAEIMPGLGNVSVVERPVRMSTLLSLVRSNLRARARQYELRHFLQEREQLLEAERHARSDAERAGRIKDEFLATLSHELRTPLNAVLGWARVLRKNPELSEEVANGLTVIERNARVQAQIIGDLLDMSSIISGKVNLSMQAVDLAEIVAATVETVRPAADAKGIRLVVKEQGSGCMRGDANRLQQVLWNLLANAVKFTPERGAVTVTLRHGDSQLVVEVADDGEGIDPLFLPHIFDRFRQADASSARRHGGLGLGLSIVRQLVELHGGTVSAYSAGPGKGSRFRLVFPVASATLASVASRGSSPAPERSVAPLAESIVNLAGLTILVVDDEQDSRALLERLLRDCQAKVMTAASADDAMLILEKTTPQLIVSDIGMPETDGYTLIRRIRALPDSRAHIPAIAVTAYARDEDRIRATGAGFHAHLSKPVDAGELQSTVERLVGILMCSGAA